MPALVPRSSADTRLNNFWQLRKSIFQSYYLAPNDSAAKSGRVNLEICKYFAIKLNCGLSVTWSCSGSFWCVCGTDNGYNTRPGSPLGHAAYFYRLSGRQSFDKLQNIMGKWAAWWGWVVHQVRGCLPGQASCGGAGAVFINVSVLTLSTSYLAPSTLMLSDMATQDTCQTLYNATLLIISIY